MLSRTGCGSGGGSDDAGELNVVIWTAYGPDAVVEGVVGGTGISGNGTTYATKEDSQGN